jgi:hypothetical protein
MVRFNDGWFDYDEEKMQLVMQYVDHATKDTGYSISDLGEDLNYKFDLDSTELAVVYYTLGFWAGETSKPKKNVAKYKV